LIIFSSSVGHKGLVFRHWREKKQLNCQEENYDGKMVEYIVQASTIENRDDLYLKWTGDPWLTLITCYPFDSMVAETDQRFLIFSRKQS